MVKLYREKISPQADVIEAELRDMVFGYECEIMNPAAAAREYGPQHSLPVITNNEKVVSGEEIREYMQELHTLMIDWQAFQSDCCYVNDKDEAII
jgi:hypothetical protein